MNEEVLALQELIETNKDIEWITNNYSDIQKKCSNKFIAVKNKKILACEEKIELLIKTLTGLKKDPNECLIDYIYNKNETLVV